MSDAKLEAKEPDYEGYIKALEKILDGVTKDYWASYIDISRHQVNVGKTYLWVSAALIGSYVAAYEKFKDHLHLQDNYCFVVFIGFAFLLCCVAFGICLYAIPARKGYMAIPNKGWGEFSSEVYSYLEQDNPRIYAALLTSLISKIDHAYAHNFKTNQARAKLLRFTSWMLISSFIFAVFSTTSLLNISTNHNEENKVTDTSATNQSNTPSPTTSSTPSTPIEPKKLQVPKPPPSADIGVSKTTTHAFDSATPTKTFSLEDRKGK